MRLAWSVLARRELEQLYAFSAERWGHDTARRYLEDVRHAAQHLARDPDRGRPLRGNFRIVRIRSHYLIMQVDAAARRLIIARVLHTAMDIERHLP